MRPGFGPALKVLRELLGLPGGELALDLLTYGFLD
jgi:hypothetical protein